MTKLNYNPKLKSHIPKETSRYIKWELIQC